MAQRTGDYRHRVIIQKRVDTRDGAGQPIPAWSQFGVRWVSRRVLAGTESFQGGVARQAELSAEFRTHLTRGISSRMRVLFPGDVTKLTATATGVNLAATGTTVLVSNTDGFPLTGKYRARMGSELFEVTAGQGTTTWTVTRGIDGTSAATSNATGTAVQLMQPYDIESARQDWAFGAETVITGRLSDGVN